MSVIRKVACAMSGGVDSSVTALLLKKMGFHVEGVFMRNWDLVNETGVCSQDQDLEDAHYVCQKLDIPLKEVNFVKEYWNDVFSQLIEGYEHGFTPNPDVLCNRHIKFGHLYRHVMQEMGADALATGHYCRNSNGQFLQHYKPGKNAKLLVGVDPIKDQSLFLAQISQEALQRSMFPVGGYMKSKVKAIAQEAGLDRITSKKESMGICFIGSRNFQSFIDEYLPPAHGEFVDVVTGQAVGEHRGIHYWTLGQRAHISGRAVAYFIQNIDPSTNTIYVAPGTRHPSLFCHNLVAEAPHWISLPPSPLHPDKPPLQCSFKYQHIHPMSRCTVYPQNLGEDGARDFAEGYRDVKGKHEDKEALLGGQNATTLKAAGVGNQNSVDCRTLDLHSSRDISGATKRDCPDSLHDAHKQRQKEYGVNVRFEFPLRAVAPGQYAVFYDGDVCMGAAQILHQGPTLYELGNVQPVEQYSTFT